MTTREAFEKAVSASPFERDITRHPLDETITAWPGAYIDLDVDMAWHMWQAGIAYRDQDLKKGELLCGQPETTEQLQKVLDDLKEAEKIAENNPIRFGKEGDKDEIHSTDT